MLVLQNHHLLFAIVSSAGVSDVCVVLFEADLVRRLAVLQDAYCVMQHVPRSLIAQIGPDAHSGVLVVPESISRQK